MSAPPSAAARRFQPQFSLRMMMGLVFVCGASLAVWNAYVAPCRREQRLLGAIAKLHAASPTANLTCGFGGNSYPVAVAATKGQIVVNVQTHATNSSTQPESGRHAAERRVLFASPGARFLAFPIEQNLRRIALAIRDCLTHCIERQLVPCGDLFQRHRLFLVDVKAVQEPSRVRVPLMNNCR